MGAVRRFQRVIGAVGSNGALARLTTAYFLFVVRLNVWWIALLVYAFHHGGATASGVVATVLFLPPALVGPLVASIADRRSPIVLLVTTFGLEALLLTGMGAAIWSGAPPLVVYALALADQMIAISARPAHFAGLPAVSRDASELTCANVAAGWADIAGLLGGAMLVSVFFTLNALGAAFVVSGGIAMVGAALLLPVHIRGIAVDDGSKHHRLRPLVDGVRISVGGRRVRTLMGLVFAQYVVIGALDVLLVVVAIQELGRGQSWVGYLNTAYGLGALVVGIAMASLVGRRIGPVAGAAAAATVAALALIGSFPDAGLALLLVAILGASRAVLLLVARARLQVSIPPAALGRVFGAAEGLSYLAMAIGTASVPLLIHAVGVRGALLAVGALLPLAVLAGIPTLVRFDDVKAVPVAEVALLRSLPHFADIPTPALESLAVAMERVEVLPGAAIVNQGERGDKFYAIADGEVQVTIDEKPRHVLHRGDGFGEIALLRDEQRTATVSAVGPVTVFALAADPFLAALSGHAPTRLRVDTLASRFLSADVEPTSV
jgi:hypothetical protein